MEDFVDCGLSGVVCGVRGAGHHFPLEFAQIYTNLIIIMMAICKNVISQAKQNKTKKKNRKYSWTNGNFSLRKVALDTG